MAPTLHIRNINNNIVKGFGKYSIHVITRVSVHKLMLTHNTYYSLATNAVKAAMISAIKKINLVQSIETLYIRDNF